MKCQFCGETICGDELTCNRCGNGFAAINGMLPIFQDRTWYNIVLIKADSNNSHHVDAIARILNEDTSTAKAIIERSPAKFFDGDAATILKAKEVLDSLAVTYEIDPFFRWTSSDLGDVEIRN